MVNKLKSWIYHLAPTPKPVFFLQHGIIRSDRYILTTLATYQIISSRIVFDLEVGKEILFSNYQCRIVSFLGKNMPGHILQSSPSHVQSLSLALYDVRPQMAILWFTDLDYTRYIFK